MGALRMLGRCGAIVAALLALLAPTLASATIAATKVADLVQSGTNSSADITLGSNVPGGGSVVVGFSLVASATAPLVTDPAGNTYNQVCPASGGNTFGSRKMYYFVANGVSALTSGQLIHVAWSTTTNRITAFVVNITGGTAAPYDTCSFSAGTSTAGQRITPVPSATPSATPSLALGMTVITSTAGAWTEAQGTSPSWTTLTATASIGNDEIHAAVRQPASTPQTYDPAWATARVYGAAVLLFKDASATGSSLPSQIPLLGCCE